MNINKLSRRNFLTQNIGIGISTLLIKDKVMASTHLSTIPAVIGGSPAWNASKWPQWPRWISETDEAELLKIMRSGVWSRAQKVTQFEQEWARLIGTQRCLSTVNGTNALEVALAQMGVGAGDEVLVPPYTFVATVAAVLQRNAIPIFVDIDPATYQMDPAKIEAKITKRTKVILPVHILGIPADMTRINAIAKKNNLLVLEDACQAHLAEINGKRVGSLGFAGCFSFQNSKNLPIGEGGAIVSDNPEFMDRCYSYHNLGSPYGSAIGAVGGGYVMAGTKVRLTEYQAVIGLSMLKRLEAETVLRNQNAQYLSQMLASVPGIRPQQLYAETTQAAYHLYAFRYDMNLFKGLPKATFLKALQAEGVPAMNGYTPLNTQPFLQNAFQSKTYQQLYTKQELDMEQYQNRNHCPENDILCQEAVWITQNVLLADRKDMEFIATAIQKIYDHADKIKATN